MISQRTDQNLQQEFVLNPRRPLPVLSRDLTTSAFDWLEGIVDIAFNRSELISEIKEKSPGDRMEGNIADMKSELAFF